MSGDETETALLFYQLLPSRSPFLRRGMGVVWERSIANEDIPSKAASLLYKPLPTTSTDIINSSALFSLFVFA